MELGEKPPFLREIAVTDLLDAKVHTADFLAAIGEADINDAEIEADAARSVFAALTAPDTDAPAQRQAIALLETPESVRHLVAMLTQYDYELIQHADSIRNRCIASLLEDADDPDPRVRLKAIEMLGKVKEVALFEERVTVKREQMSDAELDGKIKDRLARLRALEKPAEEPVDVMFKEMK